MSKGITFVAVPLLTKSVTFDPRDALLPAAGFWRTTVSTGGGRVVHALHGGAQVVVRQVLLRDADLLRDLVGHGDRRLRSAELDRREQDRADDGREPEQREDPHERGVAALARDRGGTGDATAVVDPGRHHGRAVGRGGRARTGAGAVRTA